jgi:pyruvate,orthophosphate dikinase
MVYFFGEGKADGNATQRELLGGKGANLAEMTNLGLPVPPGFTISTEACTDFDRGRADELFARLGPVVKEAMARVEAIMGRRFCDPQHPLLVSVRSGARVSMPGMMDTVLNLGLNDVTVQGLAKATDNPRFANDSYRRLIQMFGDVVLGVEKNRFEGVLEQLKERKGVHLDTELDQDDLAQLIVTYKQIVREHHGREFPQDPWEQLWEAVRAVFRSWNNDRAIAYRRLHGYSDEWGTAVNVQAMVFGNMGEDCATGVAFSRDPATGENQLYGEYLVNAQGEDVVAGVRTPRHIRRQPGEDRALQDVMPVVYQQFVQIVGKLERHYRDLLDIEFTIERGKLWMLQVRSGKRAGRSAVRAAVEMVREGLLDKPTALRRVSPEQLDQLLHPTVDPAAHVTVLGKGLPASPGAAGGEIVFSAAEAVAAAEAKRVVILVRKETSPEDIRGMVAAAAILTQRGGMTSHAAVVARGMGKCCVAGCGELRLDEAAGTMTLGGKTFRRGDVITLNGNTGEVLEGRVPTIAPKVDANFEQLIEWANEYRRLEVRANSDTPEDSELARRFGAQGIGLCRTEHMFFGEERIGPMREMIVARTREQRERALAKLLPFQKEDFKGIFRAMTGLPVTIRLLDPPLHEFLPQAEDEIERLAGELRIDGTHMHAIVEALEEFNPMLGHRGCRLGITYPEIYLMQVEAILRAAIEVKREGLQPVPEIMIPLVGITKELSILREQTIERAEQVLREEREQIPYLVGTMIEIPRACLVADAIAAVADFFSFGTNDLTQMGFGFSRDDAGTFLPMYVEKGILPAEPFQALDQEGIGQLVAMAVAKGRAAKPGLKIGVCGEHGGDPSSVRFFHQAGLDYVSCSPYRVPIAILAAAQAALDR